MNFLFSAHQDEPGLWQLGYSSKHHSSYVDVEQLPMLKRPDLEMLLSAEMDEARITCELAGDVENIEIMDLEYYDEQTKEKYYVRGEEISESLKAAILKLVDENFEEILKDNE